MRYWLIILPHPETSPAWHHKVWHKGARVVDCVNHVADFPNWMVRDTLRNRDISKAEALEIAKK